MRTTKPASTISYNSIPFLTARLNDFVKKKLLSFWAFVPHKKEDDETKDHIHLYVVPSKMLQTDDLRGEMAEIEGVDDKGNLRFKSCISFRSSKFDDWFLYCCHDKNYLITKGQSRKHTYSFSDFYTSDVDELHELVADIDFTSSSMISQMKEAQLQNLTWRQFFERGGVPIAQIKQYQEAWFLLLGYEDKPTFRNGRDGHS